MANRHEDHEESDKVDGELELDELADGVVDVSAPLAGGDDGVEVVVEQDDSRGLLGDFRAADAHGEADVGLLQGWRVVRAVASDRHNVVELLEPRDEQVLVLRRAPREHFELVRNLLEDLDLRQRGCTLFLGRLAQGVLVLDFADLNN